MFRPHIVEPSELSALRDLELLARTTVEGLRQGLHRSPFHGYSAEFNQYRHYRPGDDLRYVDWKAFGRTDRLYSRQFRETTNLGALFVVDTSRSMAFPERGLTKVTLAKAAAAVLATLVIDQGDAAGVLAADDDVASGVGYVPARSGRHHLNLCLSMIGYLKATSRQPIDGTLRRAATLLRRRGLVIVASDFYDEALALQEIRRLSRMGHDIVAIHVLAREELSLPIGSATEFVDLETAARLATSPSAVADDYQRAMQAFLQRVQEAVERQGVDYLRLVTGDALERSLRRFLVRRRRAA